MDLQDLLSPRALLVGLVVVCLIALVVLGTTSSAAFGVFNSGWDGSSALRSATVSANAEATVVLDTAAYADTAPSETIAFLVAPTESYTEAELERLREFVRDGGTLVVAEDYGRTGNVILDGVGANARFDGRVVRDMRYHGPSTAMPTATNVSDDFDSDVESVMLNHGTVVDTANETNPTTATNTTNEVNATVLVATSEYAYLDTDGNGESSEDEPYRSYPVVVSESVGDGTVIAVSDPSIFINAMQERADNRAFTEALVAGHGTVLLDYSHADAQPPLRSALIRLRDSPVAQAGVGLIGLLVVSLVVHERNPVWRRRSE